MDDETGPSLRGLRDPLVAMAFGGWGDASQAASDALDHLVTAYDAQVSFGMDPSDYYDFQSSRPMASFDDDGERTISWPTTEILVAHLAKRDLVIIRGPEPNFRWPAFASTLTSAIRSVQPSLVVSLGAMLSDAPHSRPVPVTLTSPHPAVREEYAAEPTQYEGPTGITGVLTQSCHRIGIPTVSIWAACPHYVANPPNPKAALAILARLEDILGSPIDLGDLPARAELWERSVNELADEDPDVAEYIAGLEAQDDERQPQVSGDAIAAEFQRYLRRRDPRSGSSGTS